MPVSLNKRTPCVGICSTTYGDLVCRGCKRFAHEIVQWNSYDETQKDQIWQRLGYLRHEVVAQQVEIVEPKAMALMQSQAGQELAHGSEQIYLLLRFMSVKSLALAAAGLRAIDTDVSDALTLLQKIDAEIFERSIAHYERNFKVLT